MQSVRLTHGEIGVETSIEGTRCLTADRSEAGALLYGPYEVQQPGTYRVEFEIALQDGPPPMGNPVCCKIDVCTNDGQALLAERYLLYSHLTHELRHYAVEFELLEARSLEYRVFVEGQAATLACDIVRLERIGDARKLAAPKSAVERAWQNESEFLDGYLRNVTGLIHVGANLGQERRYYWLLGLDVVWVEPIREIYDKLVDNISRYPRQRAINALLADRTGEKIEFQIANNNGASSSILALEDHAILFPDISYVERRMLTSSTLPDLVNEASIPLERYQALTLDVEGAERLILEGAIDVLPSFDYVKCEVADFPARTGTPTVAELDKILTSAGFAELGRRAITAGPGNEGTFWDIVWKKIVPGIALHESNYGFPLVFDPREVEAVEKCD